MDSQGVIYLGHRPKQPLMSPPSELGYRLEPHDTIWSPGHRGMQDGTLARRGGGVPGVAVAGWYWEGGIPGTNQDQPDGQIEANIKIF